MWSRIDRYIAQHILSATAIVMLVLVGLMGISLLLDELGEVDKFYTFGVASQFTLLSLPGLAYQLLPLSCLVGTLIGLGILASNSELTVMRAAGVSMTRLILSVAKPIALVAALALLASQVGVPDSQQAARAVKGIAKAQSGRLDTRSGGWFRQGDTYLHVSAIDPSGTIFGITRHRFDVNLRLVETSYAERANYDFEKREWALSNLQVTTVSDDRVTRETIKEGFWPTQLDPALLSEILVPPSDLPLLGLSSYSSYLENQGVDATPYLLAFWGKLFQPLGIVALVLIGVAFVFGPLRGVTVGQRIITGVVIGLVFKFSQDLLAPASQVLGFSPLLAALIPILISLMVGLWLLARVR